MTFLYGINFGVTFLLTLLLIRKRSIVAELSRLAVPEDGSLWLIVYMGFSALLFLLLALSSQSIELPLLVRLFAGGSGFMLLPALFFCYVLTLVGKRIRLALLFTIPFWVHYLVQIWSADQGGNFSFYHGLTIQSQVPQWSLWFGAIVYSSQILFPIAGLYQVQRHQKNILNRFSDLSGVDLTWIKRLLLGVLIALFIALIMTIPRGGQALVSSSVSLPVLFSLIAVHQLYIAYYGLLKSQIFTPAITVASLPSSHKTQKQHHNNGQTNKDTLSNLNELKRHIEESQIYKQSRLTIDELSQASQLSVDTISEAINNGEGKNFFEFINQYRVDAVIEQMGLPKNKGITLLNIALECGFNSKTSFNTRFKQITDMTPSEYRQHFYPANC